MLNVLIVSAAMMGLDKWHSKKIDNIDYKKGLLYY